MFPPIPPLINVDMIYQYQPNPYVGLFNPAPAIIQQIPQQNPFLSQLIHTQQQIINSQILQNASMFVQQHQQQQQHHQQQHEQLQITSSQCSLPTSSTTEINDNDLASFQQETSFGDKIKFATWNVRGAVEMDKRNAIDRCLNEKMVQIACIQETKLQMTQLETANYRWHLIHRKNDHSIHCGTAILVKHNFNGAVTNFEAVTGNIFSCFVRSKESTILVISAHLTDELGAEVEFERLKNFLKLYESLPVIIFGDFNAQLGKLDLVNSDQVFMGRFLYHDKCNNNGRLLKDLASEAKLFIKNTFRSNKIYKWKLILTTCRLKDKTSTSKAIEAQTDHILTSRDGIVFVRMLRGFYRNNIKTDHKMIVADVEIRSRESGANENVIDLSLDDDVPGSSQDVEKRYSDDKAQENSTHDNQLTRKELLLRERLGRCGDRLVNEQSNSNPSTVNDVENDNLNKPNKMQISPGEPVPPGFEDVVKPVAELQVILSKYRTSPMLGLEYVIELIMGDRRPRTYHCALCDLICDTKDIIDHIKSYEHRCKYLEKHFSTVMVALSQYRHHKSAKNVLAGVVEAVCDSIEDAYGRMVPSVFENNDYTTNRAVYMKRLAGERHFDEKSGSTFIGVVDHKAIQSAFEKLAETTKSKSMNVVAKRPRVDTSSRGKRGSFDSISSGDSVTASFKRKISSVTKAAESIVAAEQINLDLISSDSDDECSTRRRKNSSSRRSSSYLRDDETEDHKYERYRAMTEKAVRNATNLLQEYEKYPEKHPMYPSEWKRYWTRRSKELEAAGRDPSKFDFSPEWSKYWLRRLRELYEDEIALKKFEIRKKLDLSADYYPRSSSSLYSYNDQPSSSSSSSYRYEKDESRMLPQYTTTETVSEDNADDEPLTVISVLRLLAALEDLLGSTLGKKVLDLLSKAVHLEKLKANLADDVLMNEENSVLLDTVKEKLKGLIIAKIVNNQQINAVRRAIRNVESIVMIIDEKISVNKVTDATPPNVSDKKESSSSDRSWPEAPKSSPTESERRAESLIETSKQIATAFLIQKMNITKERLEELTANYANQSRDLSETPYLYGVRMSQIESDFSARKEPTKFPSQSQSSSSHTQSSSHVPQQQQQQLQNKPQGLMEGGSGFAFSLFNRSSTVNAANSRNFSNRSNTASDTYPSPHGSSSANNMNSNQYNQNFRSSEPANHQQNFNRSQPNHGQQHQRFQQQQNASTNSHQQPQNSSNKGMNKNHNHHNNNFHQPNRRKPPNQMSIWESDTMMGNQSQGFDQNTNTNSIWDTNPMQNRGQQQFNHGSSYQQNTKQQQQQQQQQQQSHYNNFYQQQNQQPIWDNQFSQQQNNRNSRRH